MLEIVADLRGLREEDSDQIADHPARAELEKLLHRFAGQVIRIRITIVNPSPPDNTGKERGE